MGNVAAKTETTEEFQTFTTHADSTRIPGRQPNLRRVLNESFENPGTIEDLHKKCKELMPMYFEGAKLLVNRGISNHFQISHNIALAQNSQSGYRFGTTYVGTKQYSATESYPILFGDVDSSGNLNANIMHQLTSNVRMKCAIQMQNKTTRGQVTTDYAGSNYTASLTLGNINLFNNSGIIVAHYLQTVSEKLALGCEMAYHYGNQVPGGEIALLSAACRYKNGPALWTGTLGPTGFHVCYYLKASGQIQIGAEIETNFRAQDTVGTIAYQFDLPKSDLVFRAMIDTNWNMCSVLEKKLNPLPFIFSLSAFLNHGKNQFRLGVGITI